MAVSNGAIFKKKMETEYFKNLAQTIKANQAKYSTWLNRSLKELFIMANEQDNWNQCKELGVYGSISDDFINKLINYI